MAKKSDSAIRILKNTAENIAKGAALISDNIKDWQIIKSFMINRVNGMTLTEKQQKKLDRYQFIYNQLVSSRYSEQEVMNSVMTIYKVDQSQAYNDIRCTKELFNHVVNLNKRFEINVELQSARALKEKCVKVGDMKNAAAIGKNIANLLKLIPDIEEVNTELFEGHTIEASGDPKLLGAPDITEDRYNELLKKIEIKRGKKKIEDINYEDVKN